MWRGCSGERVRVLSLTSAEAVTSRNVHIVSIKVTQPLGHHCTDSGGVPIVGRHVVVTR